MELKNKKSEYFNFKTTLFEDKISELGLLLKTKSSDDKFIELKRFFKNQKLISDVKFEETKRETTIDDEKIKVIIDLLMNKVAHKKDIKVIESKQDLSLLKLQELKQQNNNLLTKISNLQILNLELKKILKNNTSDKKLRATSLSFLLLFIISFVLKILYDYELVKEFWTKLGILISLGIYIIGLIIGRNIKKLEVNAK